MPGVWNAVVQSRGTVYLTTLDTGDVKYVLNIVKYN